jgi:hypothetical protein
MLNINVIRERLGPGFKPFMVHLSDGRSYRVPHPEFIAVGRGFIVIVDEEQNVPRTIDTLHIVSIDEPTSDGEMASETR